MKLPHQSTPPPVDDLDSSNKTHAESGGAGGPATQIDETGGQTLDVTTIDDGEVLVRSGTTITSQAASSPGAHALGGASHTVATLAELNAKVSDATLIDTADSRLSDARTPSAHNLGGAEHGTDTLANLNSKVTDATLDDEDSPRPADEIVTTTGPTTLAVGAVADGQYLLRSGTDVIGGTPGGGGAADALSTSGADVSVSAAAPPTTGQVLKATAATTATWQDDAGAGNGVSGLEYLDTIELAADATSVSFGAAGDGAIQRALDGEADETYIGEFYFPDPGAAVNFTLQPNGETTNQASARHYGGVSTGNEGTADLRIFTSGLTGRIGAGKFTLQVKKGKVRTFTCEMIQADIPDDAANIWQNVFGGVWDDTTTEVTSLDIVASVADGIKSGAVIKLYRQTPQNVRADSADSYERHITAGVDQGSSTTTITLGRPNYGGSAVAISIQAEDATNAGTLVANLKVGGTTKLTATLDTTNTTNHRAVEQIGVHTFQPSDEITVELVGDASYANAAGDVTGITVNVTLTNEALFLQPANGVVAETILSADSNTIAVAGLDGDVHGSYLVEIHLLLADGATQVVDLNPNGGAPSSIQSRYFENWGNVTLVSDDIQLMDMTAQTNRELSGVIKASVARTQGGVAKKRFFTSELQVAYDGTPFNSQFNSLGSWLDTAANLTSIEIVNSVADGFLAGSRVTVKKA